MNTTRAMVIATLLSAGCGDADGAPPEASVRGRAVLVDRTTHALLEAELLSVNGDYGADCTDRAGSWSLEIAANATLDHDVLEVVRNDTDCELIITELRTSGGLRAATPSFTLGTSYQSSASAFGSPVLFYANARASALSFATDFVVTILFSDDPELATEDHTADFSYQTASVDADSVPSPDNTLDLSAVVVQADIDDIVQSVSGNAVLTATSVQGSRYAVVSTTGLTTYATLDAAYLGATSAAFSGTVPATAFSLVATDLTATQVRTLIIADIQEGVRAYQAFEITFNPPVR